MPTQFELQLQHKKSLQGTIDNIDTFLNGEVWGVLKMFGTVNFGYTGADYNSDSPTHVLFGNHLWAQCFDTFEVHDGELYAQGMYQGARSYYEPESIRFPVAWLGLDDEALPAAMLAAWQVHLDKLRQIKEDQMVERVEKERHEYARLHEKYGRELN